MPEPPPSRLRDLLTLVGLGLAMMGIFLAGSGAYVLWSRYDATRNWPTVDSQIISGTLYSRAPRSSVAIPSEKMWGVHFLVRYHIGESTFDSLADIGYLSASQTEMEHWLHTFTPGSHHLVRYDPMQPGRVILTGQHIWQTYPGPVRIIAAGAACFLLAVVLIRIARRVKPQPPA